MRLPWRKRETREQVFEKMFDGFLAGYEQGLGRPLTEAEKAEERARWLVALSRNEPDTMSLVDRVRDLDARVKCLEER